MLTSAAPKARSYDVAVAGGGVIGLSTAFAALSSGRRVVVIEPDATKSAAWVAAGMLAPASEAHFGEEALTRLLLAGAARWPDFASALEGAAGETFGFRTTPTVAVGVDAADRSEVRRLVDLQQSLGIEVSTLDRASLRAQEPLLAGSLLEAALFRGDHQVDNRALLGALRSAVVSLGGFFIDDVVCSVSASGAIGKIETAQNGSVKAADVVVALGARTSQLPGITGADLPIVRPVKGHVLRLRGAEPLIDVTVRALVHGRSVYLVPRADGRLVVGATSEERGFDTTVTAGEVHQLLDDARIVLPGLDELELEEAIAGLRPGTTSNAPVIQRIDDGPVIVATGHFRNGILLAPITAEIVMALLSGTSTTALDLLAAAQGS